jgi:general secretion pathway protein G
MLRRPTEPSRVFFPWEKKHGAIGALGRARARLVVGVGLALLFVFAVRHREEKLASIRATRASIDVAIRSVASYRADHGACPKDLSELVPAGYARDLPVDAWGRPLRLACPGRRDQHGLFDVYSDGPDGLPGGLDRVE